MARTFGGNSTDMGTGQPFAQWPFAVRVQQSSGAGVGTPACLGPQGQSLGSFSVADSTEMCECLYLNTGT
jgi:hypothetical protein